jgi:hypothetical protein
MPAQGYYPEAKGAEPKAEEANFPEPKTACDRIALKASELLDRDIWDSVSNKGIVIRDVKISNIESGTIQISTGLDAADIVKEEAPSKPFAEVLRQSFKNAMARHREKHFGKHETNISNDNYEKEKRQAEQDKIRRDIEAAERRRRQNEIEMWQFGAVLLGLLVLVLAAGLIFGWFK